jgi:hypothetical protein
MNHLRVVSAAFILMLGVVFISCDSDDGDEPKTDGSTLNITPDTVRLTSIDSVKTAELVLSCGCGFSCEVASLDGDTNTIKYDMLDTMSNVASKHTMRFHYQPSTATVPVSPLTVNFKAMKQEYTYTNKIVVLVTP